MRELVRIGVPGVCVSYVALELVHGKMAELGAPWNYLVHHGKRLRKSAFLQNLDHPFDKIALDPAIEGGVTILMRTPQDVELAPVLVRDPGPFERGVQNYIQPGDKLRHHLDFVEILRESRVVEETFRRLVAGLVDGLSDDFLTLTAEGLFHCL